MTRQEAIEILLDMANELQLIPESKQGQAFKMAINALEQEPCEDAISRQAVLEIHSKYGEYMGATKFWEFRDSIRELPLVKPQEPKTGHWIDAKVGKMFPSNDYKCSECGNILDFDGVNCGRGDANFCPNCGAEMKEGEV